MQVSKRSSSIRKSSKKSIRKSAKKSMRKSAKKCHAWAVKSPKSGKCIKACPNGSRVSRRRGSCRKSSVKLSVGRPNGSHNVIMHQKRGKCMTGFAKYGKSCIKRRKSSRKSGRKSARKSGRKSARKSSHK